MSKITPFIWIDNNLDEAVDYYTSIFKNSKVKTQDNYGDSVPVAEFELEGQEFYAMQGGPQQWKFNESISFFVSCKDQDEVDYYWNKLTANGGEESMCGWLKDKYGLSWQIVPERLKELMTDKDPAVAEATMQAMMKMRKIIVKDLEEAVESISA